MKIEIHEHDLSFTDPDVFNLYFDDLDATDPIVKVTISDDIITDLAKAISVYKNTKTIASYRIIENTYKIRCVFNDNLYGTTPKTGNDAFVGDEWMQNTFATKLMYNGTSIWLRIDPMDISYTCYAEADITEHLRNNEEIRKALQ